MGCAPSDPEPETPPPSGSAHLVIDDEALYWIDRSVGGIQRHDRATLETATLTAVSSDGGLNLASNGASLFWDEGGPAMGLRTLRLSDGQTRTLAVDLEATGAVAATEDTVVFGARGDGTFTVHALGLEGGAPTVLAQLETPPLALTVGDDGYAYGTNCWIDGVWRVPVAGGDLEVIVPGTDCPRALALDETRVLFHDLAFTQEQIFEIERDGGARGNAVAVRTVDGSAFTVRNGELIVTSSGTIVKIGDESRALGEASSVVGVAADEGIVYWLEQPEPDGPIELRQAEAAP